MKKAFTMIELIFVIVILGILAAVAIPKLAATRTDAKAAALGQEIQSAVQEISNYVTAHGGEVNSTKLTNMSQVLKQLVTNNKATENSNGTKVIIKGGDGSSTCVTLETNTTALKVDVNESTTDLVCKGVKNIIKDANYTLAGSSVTF